MVEGSAWSVDVQNLWDTTREQPAFSSPDLKVRPIAAGAPSVSKKFAVAGIVRTSRAGPKPVSTRPFLVAHVAADTFSNERAWRRNSA